MRKTAPRGAALMMVLLLMAVSIPLALFFVKKTGLLMRMLFRERASAAARRLGDDLVIDYLTQFSKGTGYYENHFSADVLDRTRTFFESGFASVTVSSSAIARTVLVRARGEYGSGTTAASDKTLEVLFRFVPLIGQYGIAGAGSLSFNIPFMTIGGPMRAEGDVNVIAANVTFNAPVIAGRSLNALGSTKFMSQVYYQNTFVPAFNPLVYIGGMPIHDTPPGASFAIDRNFYQINCTTRSLNQTVWWEFRDNAGTGEYRSWWDTNADNVLNILDAPVGPWTPIPAAGGIFLVENAKTYVSGVVRGRVTIVCVSNATDPATEVNRGVVEVIGPTFGYAGGNNFAIAGNSIFVLSSRGFIFSQVANGPIPLEVHGAYYAENTLWPTVCGNFGVLARRTGGTAAAGDQFVFVGSANNMGLCDDYGSAAFPASYSFDPNLQLNPSPGVPEKPVILGWRRTRQ